MNPKVQYRFTQLENAKAQITGMVAGLSQRDLEMSFGGKWSVAQILIHIITSEKLALQYMQKKSLGIDQLKNSGPVEAIKLVLLTISQRIPVKYKAPKPIREKTPDAPAKELLFKLWDGERENLRLFLERIDSKHIQKMIFKHPVAGMLDTSQGLAFLREHIIHHKPQIAALLTRIKNSH
jgi:uncharacterized damage-inducible protein DinB